MILGLVMLGCGSSPAPTDTAADLDSPAELDLSALSIDLSFDVDRRLDPDAGVATDTIGAYAGFLTGTTTVDVGPQVWFEGPDNTVTLDRVTDPVSGATTYESHDLTLADYHFAATYDLEAPGDPDGLPPFLVTGALRTVPADFQLLAPDFLAGVTIDRASDFTFRWTPAQSYPDGSFGASLGSVQRQPWDDGEDAFPASDLSALDAGPSEFAAFSNVLGPAFGLAFSSIQTCQSSSTLRISAPVTLE